MGKRFVSFIVALTMVLPVATATAPAVLAAKIDCNTFGEYYNFDGDEASSPNNTKNGAQAVISFNGGVCTNSGLPTEEAISSWVALVPRICQPDPDGSTDCKTQIIQVGFINRYTCNVGCPTPKLDFFWAYGGCNGARPTFRIISPSLVGFNPSFLTLTNFQVSLETNTNTWDFFIGGSLVEELPKGTSATSCWDNTTLKVQNLSEKHDRGDSFGSGTHPTLITNNKYRIGSTWTAFGTGTGACSYLDSPTGNSGNPSVCSQYTSDDVKMWD